MIKKGKSDTPFGWSKNNLYFLIITLCVVCLFLLVGMIISSNNSSTMELQRNQLITMVKELESPKYDVKTDFLEQQCGLSGNLCLFMATQKPSEAIEQFTKQLSPNVEQKYRIFIDINLDEVVKKSPKYSCDSDENKNRSFDICHSVITTNPRGYLSLIASMYSPLKLQGIYNISLMAKPVDNKDSSQMISYVITPPKASDLNPEVASINSNEMTTSYENGTNRDIKEKEFIPLPK